MPGKGFRSFAGHVIEMSCIVCGKPVRSGANVCSSGCALQAAPKSGKVGEEEDDRAESPKRGSPVSSLIRSLQDTMALSSVQLQETKMIKIQHKWMKNRNLVSNRTVLSFNGDGLALVKPIGSVLEDIEAIMKRFPGQMTILSDEVKIEEKIGEEVPYTRTPVEAVADGKAIDFELKDESKIEEPQPPTAPEEEASPVIKKKKHPMMKQKTEEN